MYGVIYDNPFVENYELEKARAAFEKRFHYWADRMKFDAWYARNQTDFWSLLFGGSGHWSWVLKREQRKRFEKSKDPMLDYPEDLRPFVIQVYERADLDQNVEFDRLWKVYKAAAIAKQSSEKRGSDGKPD